MSFAVPSFQGRRPSTIPTVAAGVAFLAGLLEIKLGVKGLTLAGAALIVVLLGIAFERAPAATVTVGALLLPFTGFVRRLVEPTHQGVDVFTAATALVGGLFFALCWRRNKLDTPLAHIVSLYWLLLVLEIINPLSGGLSNSLLATGFGSIPFVWFFVGRATLNKRRLVTLIKAIGVVSIVVALYGLKQEFLGFSGRELEYINFRITNGYQALSVNGTDRPFSTLSSSAEYAHICALGSVCVLSFRRLLTRLPACALLLTTVFLAGSRGIFVFAIVSVAIAITAMLGKRLTLPQILVAVVLVVALGGLALSHSSGRGAAPVAGSGFTSASVARSVSGLSDPLNATTSTLPVHLAEVKAALETDARRPLGVGSGGLPFGTSSGSPSVGVVSEVDLVDRITVAGYLAVPFILGLIFIFARLGRKAGSDSRKELRLLAVVPIVLLNAWFNTNEYSVNALFWLLMGGLDVGFAIKERKEAT